MIIKQFLPHASTRYLQFRKDKSSLIASLNKNVFPSIDFQRYDFNPYPLLLDKSLIYQIEDAHTLLIKAANKIITHFLKDSEIQDIISLPDKVIDLLNTCKNKAYTIGAIRPDFLFDRDYNIRICEINARYPSNVFMLAEYLYEEMFSRYNSVSLNLNKKSINSTATIREFFDLKKSINILIDKENSFEMHILKNKLLNSSYSVKMNAVLPEESLSKQVLLNEDVKNHSQFILNLQQEELLNIQPELLAKLIDTRYFNDIRTIFILHDKRFLSILSNKDIMSKYITSDEFNRLSKYIIPTYLLNEKTKLNIDANPKAWVLKKCAGGKGEGMYVGKETSHLELKKILLTADLEYIAQPFIEQPLFNFINYSIADKSQAYDAMYLIGSILSFNGQLLGPGLFRASHKTIVNVASGTSLFAPLY